MYHSKEQVMKELFIFLAGVAVGLWIPDATAQTYVITTPQGYQAGVVQVNGNQATVVNNAGYPVQNITVYPNQVVAPSGYAVGTPSYIVPMTPPSPPSPRVLQ
jgi:hypothetical protein